MPAATLLLSAMLVVALDQATKALVLSRLRKGQAASCGWVVLRQAMNPRVYGNFLGSRSTLFRLWLVEAALLLGLVQFAPIFQGVLAQVALGVGLGGASSNLFDRLSRGGVVDFIDVGFWPVFNVADTAIVTGGVVGCAVFFFRLAA